MIKNICLFLIFYIILVFPYQISNADFYIDANKYKQIIEDIKIKKIIQCESEGKTNIWGDKNYIYPSYGITQIQNRTFLWLSDISGKKNLRWKNPKHQIELLKWALQNGQGKLWTCYRILSKKGEI